jgi:adrenodoxin-NADP+ reductase
LIERLPTPYGLVRFGVAPDHQEVKSVQHDFAEVVKDPRIRFYGNVQVGKDVTIDELKQRYDAVILASGADEDRHLGLENETKFIRGAREFVAWYNGHPDVSDHTCNYFSRTVQNSETCVVVGNGNVAIDCARILLSSIDKLKTTDIADRALEALSRSKIRNVAVVGRRGHPQASFTMKELRELTKMPGVTVHLLKDELDRGASTEASKKEIESQRPTKRMDALLRETLASPKNASNERNLHLRFLLSPHSIVASGDSLQALKFQKIRLAGAAGHQSAEGTGEFEDIPCQMALRSVGYRATPLEETIPFDRRKGVVVTKDGGRVAPGLYAVGWVKRGPTGIIGTNIPDAHETVEVVVKDTPGFDLSRKTQVDELEQLLKRKNIKFIDWAAYQRIERAEDDKGKASSPPRPRVKFESVSDMLRVANSA